METAQIVELTRSVLMEVGLLAAPILGAAILVSLLINIVQVLTSLQETTISTVPRLFASAAALFFLLPWMLRHLNQYTIHMFSDLGRFAH